MTHHDFIQFAVPAMVLAFFAVALVLPLVRAYRRTGELAVTFFRTSSFEHRVVGSLFGALLLVSAGWAVACALADPSDLGLWAGSLPVAVGGLLVSSAGIAFIVVAQAQMGASWRIGIDDRPTALVQSGVYAWVRHPIYTGVLVVMVGLLLATPSTFSLVLLIAVLISVAVEARLEERHLRSLHKEAYDKYSARTGGLLPRFGQH